MGEPFQVLFLCKNCGHAIEEFDLFMLHKQKYHLMEFEKIKCIVFEENITFRPDSPDERNSVPIISHNEPQQEQETDFTQLLQDQPDQDHDQPFNATPADQSNNVELLNSVIADSHLQPFTVTAVANFPCADPSMDIDENENFKAAAPESKLPNSTAVSKDEQQTDEEFSDESLDDDYDSDESDPDGGFYMSDLSDSELAFESEFAQLETELKGIDSLSQNTSSLLPNTKIDGATTTTGTETGTGMTTNNTKNKAIDNKVAQSTTSFVKIPLENPTDPQYKFECQQQQFCLKKFPTEEEPPLPFITHLESHQNKNQNHQSQNQNQEQQNSAKKILCKFKCEFCGEFFRLQHFLNRHIALVHSAPSAYSLSVIDDDQPKILNNSQCSQQNCSLTFQTASELLAHENLHRINVSPTASATSQAEAETLYLCCEDDCDKVFNTSSTLEAHIKSEHGDINCPPLFTCKICQKSFKLESALKIHCTVHEKPFTCPREGCSASFQYKRYLQQHERAHLSPGRRRQMRLLQSLQSPPGPGPEPEVQVHHQSSPNATNPKGYSGSFICEVCGRAFSQFFYLTRHLVKHSKDRPFNCPHQPTCKRSFKTTAAVKLHCQRGHGDGIDSHKIKCLHPSCPEGFTTKRARKDHLETEHHGYRPYRCQHNECDKSFLHPVSYRRHLVKQHNGSSG